MKSLSLFSFLILIHLQVMAQQPAYQVHCESADSCPEAIAGISFDGKVCTGVLVADDIIATNQHCIPDDIRQQEASCKGRITVSFPKTKHSDAQNYDCEKVKWLSPPLIDTALTPDYAFIQLAKKPARMKMPINTSGFSDGEKITLYKIDPKEDSTGLIRKVTCTAVQNSLANPFFIGVKSPVVSLVPCHIVKGNSGTPMVTESLEVKGLVNSAGSPADVNLQKAPFSQVGFGSSFACLNIPLAKATSPLANCNKSILANMIGGAATDLISKIIEPLMKAFNTDVNAELQKIHEQSKFVIRWDIEQKDHPFDGIQTKVSEISFKPACVSIRKEKLRNNQGKLQSGSISYDLNYLEWALEINLDDSGRPRGQLIPKRVRSKLTFNPSQLALGEQVSFNVDQRSYQIPFCEYTAAKQ